MKLVTVEEMRALERAAVDAGISEVQLMEEAGLAVAQEAWLLLGALEGRRITVLVGPGNNGGDGLVAARHLAGWEAEVHAVLVMPHGEAARVEAARESGVVIHDGTADVGTLTAGSDLVIDAMLGIGRARGIEKDGDIGIALVAVSAARGGHNPPKLVAVDIPTGMDADTGAVDPLTVTPDITVTFGFPKVGMYQLPGSGVLGRVQVIDIGIPKAAQESVKLELLTARWVRETLPARRDDANKGTFGRLLVVGGSLRFQGAPRLAATAAYRAGAGLVTIAAPEPLIPALAAGIPEATFLPLGTAADGTIREDAVFDLRAELPSYNAAVLGPGMGNTESTRALTWAILPDTDELRRGVVFDADALNAIAAMDDAAERLPYEPVLTPHAGEMARLLGCPVREVEADRLGAARRAAERFKATVVLKGAHTVIVAPDGRGRLSPFANPLLATAGTGDVLAGMIGGYISQNVDPFEAACLGVYLHGACGETLRQDLGDAGLLAGEVAARLPSLVRELRST